jgi:hypothetical protein
MRKTFIAHIAHVTVGIFVHVDFVLDQTGALRERFCANVAFIRMLRAGS